MASAESRPLLAATTDTETNPKSPSIQHVTPSRAAGVARMDRVSAAMTSNQRIGLFLSIFIAGFAYGLEAQVRSAYQPNATASFSLHSYLATINVLRSVVAVAVQPTCAKIADVAGRFEVIFVATCFYVGGMAIESTASTVWVFCLGGIIYQIGYTAIVLLLEVLIADFSSMRARVFFSYIPALPFVINAWLSGTVTSAVLSVATWRWGIGMWCIIYPIATAPLLIILYKVERSIPADKAPEVAKKLPFMQAWQAWAADVFDQLDIFGLFILVASFSLVLAPLTIAGGTTSHWQNPVIIILLTLGVGGFITFIIWEKNYAKTPLVPFHLLADRGVWAALAVRSLLNVAWYIQGTYLYTVLVVAFDFSIQSATRILSFFSFFGVVSGVLVGLVVYRTRRLKYIIVIGTIGFVIAFVLLILNPGGAGDDSRAGVISAQVLLGLASGFFAYPTQASIQASASRDHVAILTGLYLSFFNVGSAMGTAVSGAVWTQTLYSSLQHNLAFQDNSTLAKSMYDDPFKTVAGYPVGTDIRSAIIQSYGYVQGLLCAAGLAICLPMVGFAMALRNPRLGDALVQEDVDNEA